MTKALTSVAGSLLALATWVATAPAQAAPCLVVTLTGTMSGPPLVDGIAGAGTLVSYGEDDNDCGITRLQFDTGRGTGLRLSQVGVSIAQLNAIFLTHMHSDHTSDLSDIMHSRWQFASRRPKLDVVCSSDSKSPFGFTVSCSRFVTHIGDIYLQSGDIALRRGRDETRPKGGPAELVNLITFEQREAPQVVWSFDDVRVSAIRSTHVPGHASYRVDTPAGSVVIGGDAGNDVVAPPRATSTSDQVERLAMGVDILVHSAMHPVMGPDNGSGMPPAIFHHQSGASDLGAMARRVGAKHLMLTHLAPPIGAARLGPYKVPGGPLTEAGYRKAVEASGFTGNIIVGTDLASIRLPVK